MAETFQVDFTGNDQLSPILKRVSDELERTYLASDDASKSLSKFSSAMSKTAKVDIGKVSTDLGNFVTATSNMANIGNSAAGLEAFAKALSKIGRANLGNTASELSILLSAMVKMSTVGSPNGLITMMNALKNASFAKLATQMDRLAISTDAVAKNMVIIANAVAKLPATNIVVKNQNTNSTNSQTGGGGGGGGGGSGGNTPRTFASTWQSTLHLFNSISFASSVVTSSFSKLYDVIERGNELEKSQVTLMGLVQSAGLIPSANAAMKYSQAMQVAYANQQKFGGTLKENIDALLVFQQMSNTTGVSVQKLNDIINLLALRDPAQGIQGATIALQELMSGDPMSLRRRFELPAKEVNKLANYAGDANAQIAGLTELLKNQGITADILNARLNTTAATYDRLNSSASNAMDIIGQSTAKLFKGPADAIASFLARNSTALMADQADTSIDVSKGEQVIDITKRMTAEKKAYYEELVRGGIIEDQVVLDRINAEDHAYAYAVAMDNKYRIMIAERHKAERIAFVESTGANPVIAGYTANIDDMIGKQRESNEAKATDVVLNAAVRASELGHADAAERLSRIRGISIEQAKEIIDLKKNENLITQEQADIAMGLSSEIETLSDAYRNLIDSMIVSNQESLKQQNVTSLLNEANKALIGGTINLSTAEGIIAAAFGVTNDKAKELLIGMMKLANFDTAAITRKITGLYIPGTEQFYGGQAGQAQREMLRAYSDVDLGKGNAAYMENVNRILNASMTKKTGVVKDNNKEMLKIESDTLDKLLQFDEESYRKRIHALQSYYAYALQMQQMQAYEMTANDLDLVEGKGKEIDAKEKQRLLARENIEAHHQLKSNEAVRKANEIAQAGNGKFAQTYLQIQEEKFAKEDELAWKYHDTQVRLGKDPEALNRAKTIYEKSLTQLDEYYGTKTSLAEAASRDESEAERMQRKQIITDAIDAVKNLTNVDETGRKNIIDNLTIAGNSINDLSNKYVTGIDAMRGSLELLAAAMLKVKENASILTPDQLSAFNGMPSGIGGGQGNISINDSNNISTVNVGGISVSITNQADANAIAQTVLGILQSQINTRRP